MTPQERDQLTQFLKQLADARAGEKNAEADALIREATATHPDATYLLVQRAMLVEQALNAAKAQIAQLQSQVQALQNTPSGNRAASFLGGGNPWAQAVDSGANPTGVPGAASYQIPRGGAGFNAALAQPAAGGGVGGFLGNVATTAAGVVAGSFLFQGVENLLGNHHALPSSLWGDTPAGEHVSEQTIINNYYDTDHDTQPGNELARDDWAQPDEDETDFVADDDSDALFGDNDDSRWV